MSGPARPGRRPAPRPRPQTHGAVAAPGIAPPGGPAPEAAVPSARGCGRHPAPRGPVGGEARGPRSSDGRGARSWTLCPPHPRRSVPRGPAPGPAPRRGRVITSGRGGLGGVSRVIDGAAGSCGAAGGDAQEERS